MDAAPGASNEGHNKPRTRWPALFSHLNPLHLYDPRISCGQNTFFWGFFYPALLAVAFYIAAIGLAILIGSPSGRKPGEILDFTALAQMVLVALTAARLILGPLIILRRTKDIGWTRVTAPAWLLFALLTVCAPNIIVFWAALALQVLIWLALLVTPSKTSRAGNAS